MADSRVLSMNRFDYLESHNKHASSIVAQGTQDSLVCDGLATMCVALSGGILDQDASTWTQRTSVTFDKTLCTKPR